MEISPRLAKRLKLQASDLKRLNGLYDFRVSSDEVTDGRHLVSFRGSPASLDKAEASIKALYLSLTSETWKTIQLPQKMIGIVLGSEMTRWSDMVVRYGGPTDKNIQRDIIEM